MSGPLDQRRPRAVRSRASCPPRSTLIHKGTSFHRRLGPPCKRREDRVQRLTYRKRHSYATKSNQNRVVKTPGGKLVYQSTKKRASCPKCPVTGKRIQVIPHLNPAEYRRSRLPGNRHTVNHAYGGVLSGSAAVRERIIGAFLVEQQKIVKNVLKNQKAKEKLASNQRTEWLIFFFGS